jgi:hypothetical protein
VPGPVNSAANIDAADDDHEPSVQKTIWQLLRRVSGNHRTRFLQEILRSGHDAFDQYWQALIVSFVYPGP